MPELPEVETVLRGLRPAMEGKVIENIRLSGKPLRFPYPSRFCDRLRGRRVERLRRRAKYLLAELDSSDVLIMHLGMSGRFTVHGNAGAVHNLGEFYYEQGAAHAGDGPHDHVVFDLSNRMRLVYTDPRRFGIMDLCPTDGLAAHKLMRNIGVEPLGNALNAAHLHHAFAGKRAPLKAALLDQRIIAGLGNIYVCEALHRSGLSPRRLAGTLAARRKPDIRLERLVLCIRAVLAEAIEAGGSTLRDYVAADGTSGEFQQRFAVYDREDADCPKDDCGGKILRIVQSGRSTFYCPRCQR